MKFLVKIVFFLLLIFILNIIFYYISWDYRVFLENLKYNTITNNIDTEIIDEFTWDNNYDTKNNLLDKVELIDIDNLETNKNHSVLIWTNTQIISETILWKNYVNILNKFDKKFNLDKIDVNTNLFELTDEYPDYYYEYYSNDLTLYFFTTKQYSEIYDIFNYIQNDLPFSINEVNNFWENSFYINLNTEINDSYIRLVITENWITFWLKIKDTQYDVVKNILLNK